MGKAKTLLKTRDLAAGKGYINGKSETIFAPNDNITREEFVAIVVRAFEMAAEGDIDYSDVSVSDWYYEPIRIATNNGIITGSDGSFGTGNNITRQDMAVILYRTALKYNVNIQPKSERTITDYDEISQDDLLCLPNVKAQLENGEDITLEDRTTGKTYRLTYALSERQKEILLAGGLLNFTRESL